MSESTSRHAQFYGPDVVNELIREALHPYPADLVIVSKVGARRDQRGHVLADDEPQQLRRAIEANLRTLAVDTLPVVNLRLMRDNEPDAFFDDQLAAMIAARDDGLIRAVGLSNITVARQTHLRVYTKTTEIASVKTIYSFPRRDQRGRQPVVDECTKRGIAFVPFGSLGFGVSGPRSVVGRRVVVEEAARLRITPAQLALA